jgi:dGTPase
MSGFYERFSEQLGHPPDQAGHPSRSAVAKDRDRIIHCGAFRRLQRKSQIVGVQSSDFFRTRLTHTIECAQIARAIAARCPNDARAVVTAPEHLPDLLEAAALAHDLGHPPFGHNGEQALIEMMKLHGRGLFEGNAQSFRIVTSLEPKVIVSGRACGLDLTRSTLRAILKYPITERQAQAQNVKKFCIYETREDKAVFQWLFPAGNATRTVATDMLEAADDIAYAAHDFEDGVWSGLIPLSRLVNPNDISGRQKLFDRIGAEPVFGGHVAGALDDFIGDTGLKQASCAHVPFDRSRQAQAELKNYTSSLIDAFIESVTRSDTFHEMKTHDPKLFRHLRLLMGMATVWMIENPSEATVRFGQRKLVEDLFEGYWRNPQILSNREAWAPVEAAGPSPADKAASNPTAQTPPSEYTVWAAKARVICDHVAGMTDLYALHVHGEMFRGGGPGLLRPIGP